MVFFTAGLKHLIKSNAESSCIYKTEFNRDGSTEGLWIRNMLSMPLTTKTLRALRKSEVMLLWRPYTLFSLKLSVLSALVVNTYMVLLILEQPKRSI